MGRNSLKGREHRNFSWNGPEWVSMSEDGKDVGYTDNYLVAVKWSRQKRGRSWSFCPKIYLENKDIEFFP